MKKREHHYTDFLISCENFDLRPIPDATNKEEAYPIVRLFFVLYDTFISVKVCLVSFSHCQVLITASSKILSGYVVYTGD